MKIISDEKKIKTLIERAVSKIVVKNNLESLLKSGEKLRVKFCIDPTAPDIHLGHTVPLLKLRQFQDLGHQAVLIIGDFTARIGDPTGRFEARKPLTEIEVKRNMKNYLKQAAKVKDIKNRIKEDADVTGSEIMYPLLQGYDSVIVKSDVEIGGEDQLLNLLMGRRIQRAYNITEQDILTTWLIEGTDGVKKMSKSSGNYIAVTEKPEIMFGKIMSIPDILIAKYFTALTPISDEEIDKIEADINSGEINPRDAKILLSFEIVKTYHGEKKAKEAAEEFERIFKRHELPENIQEVSITIKPRKLIELLMQAGLASSRSEARRKVLENAVKVDGKVKKDPEEVIDVYEGAVVQYGKRNFRKIKKG